MRRASGFTLIELMLAVAIAGILAALAYPAYHAHIVKGKRAEAQLALWQLMLQQERFYTQNNRYLAFSSASTDPLERQFKWWSGASPALSAYEIDAVACTGESLSQCVQLNAVPGTGKVDRHFADADCQTLSLSSTGQRGASGAAPRCWP
ncbi:type IV pilin protein [Janthinobacterium fluminis]|uniref:Type IV pilin protein n=1 Tax=Janthinobacterium fluminis TaxID=2987524 RepID=A0ABT5K6F1_9BURK|nr:type IV pilin protein [Janthinobacterium fluminis]MDC8760569.1 type IV pilin protein [Janthinobacterium fluminis]